MFFEPVDPTRVVGAAAVVAVCVVPVGFFIGGVTRVALTIAFQLLSWIFRIFGKPPVWFETWPSDRSAFVRRVWPLLHYPELDPADGEIDKQNQKSREQRLFYATVTFDHDLLYEHSRGIHEWLLRRWSGFSAAISSCTAMLLAIPLNHALSIEFTNLGWGWFLGVLVVLLCAAWRNCDIGGRVRVAQ